MTEKGVEFETIDYTRKGSLSASQLQHLLDRAGLKPHDVLRKNEPAYSEHVAGRSLTDVQLIRAMVEHPELIQRPIVVRGEKAVLARPVENLSALGIE